MRDALQGCLGASRAPSASLPGYTRRVSGSAVCKPVWDADRNAQDVHETITARDRRQGRCNSAAAAAAATVIPCHLLTPLQLCAPWRRQPTAPMASAGWRPARRRCWSATCRWAGGGAAGLGTRRTPALPSARPAAPLVRPASAKRRAHTHLGLQCVQERFRPVITGFPAVVDTSRRMVRRWERGGDCSWGLRSFGGRWAGVPVRKGWLQVGISRRLPQC